MRKNTRKSQSLHLSSLKLYETRPLYVQSCRLCSVNKIMVSWRGQPFWSFRGESFSCDSIREIRHHRPRSSPYINSQELKWQLRLRQPLREVVLPDFCYSFVAEFLYRGLYAHHLFGLACLRCLRKGRTYHPKWWCKMVFYHGTRYKKHMVKSPLVVVQSLLVVLTSPFGRG